MQLQTCVSAKAEHERVQVERASVMSAQEALEAERTWVAIYVRIIRDLPFDATCHFWHNLVV